ncbi:MAG TPA: glycerol-3-phosphate dehydrogenase [Candidatus Omnitrophota bacterium]|nr:glycerol-3-phosphate dehydrogenase [Candidatus Omnitrophota bacterium]HPD85393.1 glycerol-3-phosphate dehydrogenase [Candidatus Omnitrophota bacterium]HRZ04106.1 glycerol-3-phosphate dehydrogenase [Candidatus Omnitrophota bacterium]
MLRDLQKLSDTAYDVLVIGGGINGAAIANIAASRGLKVALIEKDDFASGTSSKSTKLIHGGLRYLENLEFDLVYESLMERHVQLKCAPHLVKPLGFIIPVYKGDKRPLWMMKLGVFFYDLLAGKYAVNRHQHLTKEEVMRLEPGIKQEGLKGGVMYFDAQMDDARLCLENVLAARGRGADIFNYVEARAFHKVAGKINSVTVRDNLSQKTFSICAKKVVCAVGPWSNYLLRLDDPHAKKQVRTTKGIHIVVKGQLSNHALFVMSYRDKRIFFIIPYMGNSLIGTTDTDYIGNPDNVKVDQADIDYLTDESKRIFPAHDFSSKNIVTAFAGLRPLLRSGGVLPSKATRKHFIYETASGMIVVVGGKYTTYRTIAEACVNRLTTPKFEKDCRLYARGTVSENLPEIVNRYGLPLETIQALAEKYGTRYKDVLRLTESDPKLKERICSCSPFIKAQIVYAIETEMAQTAEDIIERRLSTSYLPCQTKECEKVIRQFIDQRKN